MQFIFCTSCFAGFSTLTVDRVVVVDEAIYTGCFLTEFPAGPGSADVIRRRSRRRRQCQGSAELGRRRCRRCCRWWCFTLRSRAHFYRPEPAITHPFDPPEGSEIALILMSHLIPWTLVLFKSTGSRWASKGFVQNWTEESSGAFSHVGHLGSFLTSVICPFRLVVWCDPEINPIAGRR